MGEAADNGISQYTAAASAQSATSADALVATSQQPLPGIVTQPAVDPAHTAIIQLAQAKAAPTEDWATRAAEAISEADPLIQAGAQLSRSSPKTQAYIALGELAVPVLAKIIERFFPHPAA